KEALVARWEQMLNQLNLDLKENEEVVEVKRSDPHFEVKTASGQIYKASYVILAIGVRGTPRKLRLPNETPDRCYDKLVDPEKFQSRNILVVGGGNAGAEVAQSLAAPELRNKVSYSFREPVLGSGVSPENAEKISELQTKGLLVLYPSTQLKE